MQKAYDPASFEGKLYDLWMQNKCFEAKDESSKKPFSMALPPPNVTGALHNGHALVVTIEDILTRWKRMSGFNALWLPGKDHAGIATQMVVEREIGKEGKTRHQMGRDAFVKRIWEWKEKHGHIITEQMKKLGASADWSRERFTMDADLSKVVREVFVRLHEEGLIYRGNRLINWCSRCSTALSDLEVVPTEKKGHFWHLQYRTPDGKDTLTIATTRPETLLGDTAVAVHPDDDRYRHLVGKKVRVPLVGREVPVIADAYVDKEFGSGALKVTPGHDFNDYELGTKHKLLIISVFDKQGKVNEKGAPYTGLSTSEARERIVADLNAAGLLSKTEDHTHQVGVCQRCDRIVEPMLSDQWFLNVKPLAEKAIAAVKKGESLTLEEVDQRTDAIKIVPEGWVNTYYQWMENIRDWCISRQLWWGHQIPAWHCGSCQHITVSRTDVTKCPKCGATTLTQDEDVLDTWFSSALWPFSTLGWPEKTAAMKTFYPTAIMETGFDILFFWVARMIMMGLHFNEGRVPFKRVYLHAMVRDEKGQKMSKTRGNVIDPLDIIKDHGADAFRFTLAAMAGQGRDVKLSLDRVEGYKAFCNKLWNASRYTLMRLGHTTIEGLDPVPPVDFAKVTGGKTIEEWITAHAKEFHPVNRWILSRLQKSIQRVEDGLQNFRLNESAQEVYTFTWNEYCDWYIEFSKELLASNDTKVVAETQVCLLHVLEQMLRLAHPMMPFVTEEIYQHLPARPGHTEKLLVTAHFPKANAELIDEKALEVMFAWKTAIEALRAFRGENNISPKARPKVTLEYQTANFETGLNLVKSLAQLDSLELEKGQNKGDPSVSEVITTHAKFFIPLKGLVDVDGELKRLDKEIKDTKADIGFVEGKLSKESFISKAPPELVQKEKDKLKGLADRVHELEAAAARLKKLK